MVDHKYFGKSSYDDESESLRRLNIGCGHRLCSGWTNIDYVGRDGVLAYDIRKGLPFPDESFDVVYHSHVIEHLPKQDAKPFMRECFRVLKAKGVIRVVIPDLELLARNYLAKLEEVRRGSANEYVNYEWTVIHLLDQLTRTGSGGEMARFLTERNDLDLAFVKDTCGDEVAETARIARTKRNNNLVDNSSTQEKKQVNMKVSVRKFLASIWNKNQSVRSNQEDDLEKLVSFRRTGEVHQWMYDEISLKKLLIDCGFTNICLRNASESSMQDWSSFNLDSSEDGAIFHTDSLFMEANR